MTLSRRGRGGVEDRKKGGEGRGRKQRAAGLECRERSESRRMSMRRKTRRSISYQTEENLAKLANLKTFV